MKMRKITKQNRLCVNIVSRVTNWKDIELPEYEFYVDLLEKGIAIHHAGMLPIFREVIEILYDKKYTCLIATRHSQSG